MVMRSLTVEEKKVCEKQIERMNTEKEHLMWLVEYNELMLNKGLRMNYEEKIRETKEQVKILNGEVMINDEKIKMLEIQIRDGVEVKGGVPSGIN